MDGCTFKIGWLFCKSIYKGFKYDYDDGKEAGIAIGAQQKAEEAVCSFYANGVSIELIAKSLNMTVEQVKEIVSEKSQVPLR